MFPALQASAGFGYYGLTLSYVAPGAWQVRADIIADFEITTQSGTVQPEWDGGGGGGAVHFTDPVIPRFNSLPVIQKINCR